VLVRRGAVALVLVMLVAALATGTGLVATPAHTLDPGAWLLRGRDLVHASAASDLADWILPDLFKGDGDIRTAQDGERAIVVDIGSGTAMSIDPVNLDVGAVVRVEPSAVPFVNGDDVYLVADDVVRWLDPVTLEARSTIAIPGTGEATIDTDGRLWVVTPRDGRLLRINDGRTEIESPLLTPGHAVEVALADRQPVVLDSNDRSLRWIEPSTAGTAAHVVLPATGRLQGDSTSGPRAWIAVPGDGQLHGVARDGGSIRVDIGHRPLLRPEVADDHVYAFAGDGTVTVVDARDGTTRHTAAIDAARDSDFGTFVKDGRLWFSSPARRESGTVRSDGTVALVQEDRAALVATAQAAPEPNDPTPPSTAARTTPAPTARPGPRPTDPPTPTTMLPTVPGPAPTRTSTTTSPTTTSPTTTTTVPLVRVDDLVGRDVTAACEALTQAGLVCQAQPRPGFGTPANQVLAQDPAPGAMVARGSTVTYEFHASEGVEVPDVQGLPIDTACERLTAVRLTCNRVGQANAGPLPVPPGSVWAATTPGPGTRVGEGMSVRVVFESTPTTVWWELRLDGTYRNELYGQDQPPTRDGWRTIRLGTVYRQPTGGTYAWYTHKPKGTINYYGDIFNRSPDETNDWGPGTLIGYFPIQDVGGGFDVYMFTRSSDSFYTRDPNDPEVGLYPQNGNANNYVWP
jgi:hypothetical protein